MRAATVVLVLLGLSVTLVAGYATKTRCAESGVGAWFCYSDIPPLYGDEGMDTGRLPYLDPCPPAVDLCDEYPVVHMWLLKAAGAVSHSPEGYFNVNAAMLALAALATALGLANLAGLRAMYFAAAPALVIHGFLNWDLYPLAMAVFAVVAFNRRRDGIAGVLIGLGAATKLFPGFLLVPLVADRLRGGEPSRARRMVVTAAVTWAVLNLPFAIIAWDGWSTFFTFNATRPPEWSTPWYIGCVSVARFLCLQVPTINALSAVLFLASFGLVWWFRKAIEPDFPRWTLVFPAIALFLVTTKVYSPQYSLWLLPFFALAFPRLSHFAVFSAIDVLVSICFFTWYFGTTENPLWQYGFQIAAVARTVVLIACVVAWARGRVEDRPQEDSPTIAPTLTPA